MIFNNENQYFSPVFKETETGDIWLACSRALCLKQGQFDGVIFAGLSGRYIADEMADIDFAERAQSRFWTSTKVSGSVIRRLAEW